MDGMMTLPLCLALAMVLDAVLGEPDALWSRLPHPAVLMGRAVAALDRGLNRGAARRARGAVALAILVLGAGGLGWVLSLGGPPVEILGAAVLLAQKSLVQHVRAVAEGLRSGLPEGRRSVAMIVSRDTTDMDAPRIARSAIESAAENLSDGVIAPALWFLIGGLPGILIYKVVNTADSMIGYRTPRHEAFGWASARADDLLNLLPARLTALLLALPLPPLTGWPPHRLSLAGIVADARRHKSPNAGWPEATMARVLDVALAGPRSYDGQMRDLAWVNAAGRKQIGAPEVDRAVRCLWSAWVMALLLVLFMGLV